MFLGFSDPWVYCFFLLFIKRVIVDTNNTPKANAPEEEIVIMAWFQVDIASPFIASYIVLYIPPTGTKGIKAQTTIVVTGVFKILAYISE